MRRAARVLVSAVVLFSLSLVGVVSVTPAVAYVAPTAPAGSTYTPGTADIDQYTPPGDVNHCNANAAFVTANVECYKQLSTMRANDPSAPIFGYMKGEICAGSYCPSPIAASNPAYAKDSNGFLITDNDCTTTKCYLMQIDNSAWITVAEGWCRDIINYGFDGCFADMMGPYSYNGLGAQPVNPATGQPYSPAAWSSMVGTLYGHYTKDVSSARWIANGLQRPLCVVSPGCDDGYISGSLLQNNASYGAMAEGFQPGDETTFNDSWTMFNSAAGASPVFAVNHYSSAATAWGVARSHASALALFLTGQSGPTGTSLWTYCQDTTTYQDACTSPDPWYLFGHRNLGAGVAAPTKLSNGIYVTKFANGVCAQNENSGTSSLTYSPGFTSWELDGTATPSTGQPLAAGGEGQCFAKSHS